MAAGKVMRMMRARRYGKMLSLSALRLAAEAVMWMWRRWRSNRTSLLHVPAIARNFKRYGPEIPGT